MSYQPNDPGVPPPIPVQPLIPFVPVPVSPPVSSIQLDKPPGPAWPLWLVAIAPAAVFIGLLAVGNTTSHIIMMGVGGLLFAGVLGWTTLKIAVRRQGVAVMICCLTLVGLALCQIPSLWALHVGNQIVDNVVKDVVENETLVAVNTKQLSATTAHETNRLAGPPGGIRYNIQFQVKMCETDNQNAIENGDSAEEDLNRKLEQAGISESRRPFFVQKLRDAIQWDQHRKLYILNKRIFADTSSYNAILQENQGRWRLDRSTQEVKFDDAELSRQFEAVRSDLKAADAEQQAISANIKLARTP